ncbi:MAG: hypothetical protein KBA15_02710 [Spirochaetes bacterium]|nr:hypothetical protein [Spirochaetota bacterium]
MKHTHGEAGHQRDREINLLVQQVVSMDYSRDRIAKEIDRMFLELPRAEKSALFSVVVSRSCEQAWTGDLRSRTGGFVHALARFDDAVPGRGFEGCFAVRLSRFVASMLGNGGARVVRGKYLSQEFYDGCTAAVAGTELFREAGDAELFEIYIKQCVIMMKAAGMIDVEGASAVLASGCSGENIFPALFGAFWGKVRWEDIFPSNPSAARELRHNRHILVDLILRQEGRFTLDSVAVEFFDLTGFGDRNDVFLISFLDFYLFTWFRHFGLVEYAESGDGDAVRIYATERGKSFLRHLQRV